MKNSFLEQILDLSGDDKERLMKSYNSFIKAIDEIVESLNDEDEVDKDEEKSNKKESRENTSEKAQTSRQDENKMQDQDDEPHTPYFGLFNEDDIDNMLEDEYDEFDNNEELDEELDDNFDIDLTEAEHTIAENLLNNFKRKKKLQLELFKTQVMDALIHDHNLLYCYSPKPMVIYNCTFDSPQLYKNILEDAMFLDILEDIRQEAGFFDVKAEIDFNTDYLLSLSIQFIF